MAKTDAHQRYYLEDGTQVPGASTIPGVLDKSGPLMYWAWNLGMQGKDYRKVKDQAADIGTIAHLMIECHLKGEDFFKLHVKEYAPNDVDKASNAYIAYLDWEKGKKIILIGSEIRLVSEEYRYGGTLDDIAIINDRLTLVDFKTSKALYESHIYQTCGYEHLWTENHDPVDDVIVLRLSKEDDPLIEPFEPILLTEKQRTLGWEMFKLCRQVYELQFQMKGGRKYAR